MTSTTRALFVGGPLDGRLETDHVPAAARTVRAVEHDGPPTARLFAEDEPPADEHRFRVVEYLGVPLVDLDGSRFLVYALPDEAVPGPRPATTRPPLSIWDLVLERRDLREDLAEAERILEATAVRLVSVERHREELAAELRSVREELAIAQAQIRTSANG